MTSIRVKEGQSEGYLFLMGVEPARTITLSEKIDLEPARCHPNPDAMIDSIMKHGSQSEIDLGILVSTLRLTCAQLRVQSSDAQELAVDLWNAQTDILLLSALLHKEIYWSVQCDVKADLFDATSSVNIVLSRRLFLPRECVEISLSDCAYVESIFAVATRLMNKPTFSNAVNALWSYRQALRPSVQMAILWSGIESLFEIKNELRFRTSLFIAKLLDADFEKYQEIKKLYDSRSKAVHAANVSNIETVKTTANLLHQLILKCVEIGDIPDEKTILFDNF